MLNFKARDDFDKKENLIVMHTGSKQAVYHTKLADSDVHTIKDSSLYAKELICSGKNPELGEKIFEKVISLQDGNNESETYGLWPYYMEEPLSQMDAPDWNMAGFNSCEMIDVLYNASDSVNDDLKTRMIEAIYGACCAIIKRNEGVQYTNVAFLESLVLCCGGDMLGNEKLLNAGRNKLRKSLGFIDYQGSVFEHNSPYYSFLCIKDLGSILKYVKDKEAHYYAEQINDYIWKCLAEHFDYKNLQLGGPQCRAYSDYLLKNNLEIIMSACGLEKNYKNHPMAPENLKSVETHAVCPEKYIPYFSGEKVWDSSRRIIMRGFNYPYFAFSQTINHYRGNGFTLGTFNREEMWNQRRPFLSYIDGENKPYCFRVKCYHDGFDFSSAVLHSVQTESKVLGNINFSSDRGDTHIGLDLVKDTTIEAEDLRVVFDVVGDTGKINYNVNDEGVEFNIGNVPVKITHICTHFGDYPITYDTEKNDEYFRYSIVLYSGEKKKINFGVMEKAISAFCVEMGKISENSKIKAEFDGDYLKTIWETGGDKLELHTLKSAHPFKVNMYEDKQYLNGEELFRYLDSNEIQG